MSNHNKTHTHTHPQWHTCALDPQCLIVGLLYCFARCDGITFPVALAFEPVWRVCTAFLVLTNIFKKTPDVFFTAVTDGQGGDGGMEEAQVHISFTCPAPCDCEEAQAAWVRVWDSSGCWRVETGGAGGCAGLIVGLTGVLPKWCLAWCRGTEIS